MITPEFIQAHKRDELPDYTPLVEKIRCRDCLDKDLLLEVAVWKTRRIRSWVARNDGEFVQEVTRTSFGTASERLRISVLTLLSGVQYRVASTILHFRFPDRYTVMDKYAWNTLKNMGEVGEIPRSDFERWMLYLDTCRSIAERCGVSLRELDLALWGYGEQIK